MSKAPEMLVLPLVGIDNKSRLRVRGEGNAGRRGGPPGDLYVFVSVKDHPQLRRDGTTVHSDVEVNFVQFHLDCCGEMEKSNTFQMESVCKNAQFSQMARLE